MPRPALEVADIFRQHGSAYREAHPLPLEQWRVMRAIEVCRTAALGGHLEECGHCSATRNAYNSCRNRHCPKCQNSERVKWLAGRQADLLPVEYFHVVFTVPEQIAQIAFQNKETVYNILFRAASETLLTIAADPKHLGASIGFFALLHTWGTEFTASSASALRGSRRWPFPRPRTLASLSAGLLSPRARALTPVPALVPRSARASLPES